VTQSAPILTLTVTSAGAVARGRGVTFAGAQANAIGQKVMGIASQAANAAGEDVAVIACGTAICETGAAITVGQTVAMDASGRVVPAAVLTVVAGGTAVTSIAANGPSVITGAEPPIYAVGDALQAASGAGRFIEVLLRR
jgi:hypothetical protein